MRPGPVIRSLFGPYEHWVSEAYRRMFVSLDDFAELMSTWVPQAQRILEVGCGEGAMTERITRKYPNASVIAIDITPKVGRLFRGKASNVTFSQEFVEDVARREPASFDLIVLADVLHHVPVVARQSLMNAISQSMTANGSFIFKDWVASSSPIHWICGATDRYLTGDKVSHVTPDGVGPLLTDTFGAGAIRQTDTVRPWKNNLAVLVQHSITAK
jgi:SAM-dependent methyltransferase